MISPHLLRVVESYSVSKSHQKSDAKNMALFLWSEKPTLVIENKVKDPTWCHMILAGGPALSENSKGSELVIIWWSEMGPDTDRVLSAIDWKKHAKDVR